MRGLAADNKNAQGREIWKLHYDRTALTNSGLSFVLLTLIWKYEILLQSMSQIEFTSVAYPEKSKGRFIIN